MFDNPTFTRSSHPDKLTERELIDVTTVFHAFESGVRSGTMHHEWLKEVSKVLHCVIFSSARR